MIRLIKDGALPHPAKCACCGYSGNERFYYWFKYREKWGQVLICTTCMKEAATLDEAFVSYDTMQDVLTKNYELRAENDRLELATEKFTDAFAALVASFLNDISASTPELPVEEEPTPELGDLPVVEPDVPDELVSVESDFNASDYVPASGEFPEPDLKSIFD